MLTVFSDKTVESNINKSIRKEITNLLLSKVKLSLRKNLKIETAKIRQTKIKGAVILKSPIVKMLMDSNKSDMKSKTNNLL